MATAPAQIVPLWELEDKQEAECYLLLDRVEELKDKNSKPYRKCWFRARWETRPAMIWSSDPLFNASQRWQPGKAYRARVVGDVHPNFGAQIRILEIGPAEGDQGFNMNSVAPVSAYDSDWLFEQLSDIIKTHVTDMDYRALLRSVVMRFKKELLLHPAAERMHHAYQTGLLEHIWSLSGLCVRLGEHYAAYYEKEGVRVNTSLLIAIAVLHDIGKLRELTYDRERFATSYSLEGQLVGHVVMGRDIVREAAAGIEGFPAEKLLQIEHAILAHHGKYEFGAPKLPQTLESLIFSHLDDLDAKVNQVALALQSSSDDPRYTRKIYGLENRRFYRGVELEKSGDTGAGE